MIRLISPLIPLALLGLAACEDPASRPLDPGSRASAAKSGSSSVSAADLLALEARLTAQIDAQSALIAAQDAQIAALEAQVAALEAAGYVTAADLALAIPGDLIALSGYLAVDEGRDEIAFTGANVLIQDGSGDTAGDVNGLGNLIIGYNEADADDTRAGSHNLVVGDAHSYSSYGGLLAGYDNAASGAYATASGGVRNTASAYASVLGGYSNAASAAYSTVSGGQANAASGAYASVLGGYDNHASGSFASVGGGVANTAGGDYSSVGGGYGLISTTNYEFLP